MSYLVAIGSSDGKNINLKFGAIKEYLIYKVDHRDYAFLESRVVPDTDEADVKKCNNSGENGCGGNGSGCGGPDAVIKRVDLISDCRCILASKVGFQAQKQLEKRAISVFDISCPIDFAMDKITGYFDRY